MKKIYWLILLFSLLLAACTEKARKEAVHEEEEKEELTDEALINRITLSHDSLNTVWREMIESDNQKYDDIRRLLLEASYTRSYNPIALEDLQKRTTEALDSRYDQETMTSEQIDYYDELSESLVKAVFSFVQQTPELQNHGITNQLVVSIQDADNDIIYFRVKYDRWAKEFNQLISNYQSRLQQMGEPYSSYKVKPIFTLEL